MNFEEPGWTAVNIAVIKLGHDLDDNLAVMGQS